MQFCDASLEGHAARVTFRAEVVARRLGWSDERLAEVGLGGALHDVGKVNIRPEVLAKPGALDRDELQHVRSHPVEGAWLVAGFRSLRAALPYILFHHERWDGRGYPTGRAGRDIPVEGRLLAVVDAFDAMTSPRPYRSPVSVDAAAAEVRRFAGTQFDPELADAFLGALEHGDLDAREPLAATG